MQRFWKAAGLYLGKYAYGVIGAVLAITVVLALTGFPKLEFATGQDSYLNTDSEIATDNREYQDLFGGQAMLTLFTAEGDRTVVDLFTPENVAAIRAADAELSAAEDEDGDPLYDAVVTPLTALEFTESLVTPRDPETGELARDADGRPVYESPSAVSTSVAGDILLGAISREEDLGETEAAAARSADSGVTLERITEALEAGGATFENRAWVEFLLVDNQGDIRKALRPFFPFAPGVEPSLENAMHTQAVVRMGGNLSIEDEGEQSELVESAFGELEIEGFSQVTTGAPVLLRDINDYLQGGMATLGGIALLVMTLVLWFVFRVRWRLLSLAVVVIGCVWTFAILSLVGIPLALVTIAGLPILIGIGVDFAIQVHNRVEEEVVLDKEAHPMSVTLMNLAPPLIIATVAAVAAFLSLQISQVPMIRDFGVLLAIGIVVLCGLGIVIVTAVLGKREYLNRTTEAAPPSRIENFVPKLGSLPSWWAIPFAFLAVGVLVAGVVLEDRFEIQTDPEKWVNQDTQVISDLDVVRNETGSSAELGFFVQVEEGDVFTDEVGTLAFEFADGQLQANPEGLLTASSIVTTVGYLMEIPGSTQLAPLGDDLRSAWEVAPESIRAATVGESQDPADTLNIIFRTGPSSLEERRVLLQDMDVALAPVLAETPNVKATPSGLAVVGVGLLENLEANRAQLTYLALGLVAAWLLIRFLSITKMVLSMIPVMLAVGVSSLVVALIGIELSPMTTVSGPLVAAAVTEFSALILTRYLEERREGRSSRESSDRAAARTGRAFVASALTTIGGFGVLVFSALPLLRDFGIVVTLNITTALVVALVVLPPMLVWADDKGLMKTGAPEPT